MSIYKKVLKYPFESLFVLVFLGLAWRLNTMFLIGSNINDVIAGHDEYIAVKEVYSILHPASLKHFFMALISGNALYYGRIMFYVDALIAWLPDMIWGVKGMVMSIRMFHAAMIIASILILAFTFINKTGLRWLFIFGSITLYYTMYFIMMPKPEPMQLLFLAWFLNRFKASGWNFGLHFILLGIAYGLKFNVLLLMPLIYMVPVFSNGLQNIKSAILQGFKSLGLFIIGIVIALPCLALSPLKPIFLRTYLHETFEGTQKTYDDTGLTFAKWLFNGLGDTYLGVSALAIPFLVFALILLVMDLKSSHAKKDYSSPLLILSGLIMVLVIMLNTKRLWPHYLWTGYIFVLLGMLVSINNRNSEVKRKWEIVLMSLFVASSFVFYIKRELPAYLSLEQSDAVIDNYTYSEEAIEYLKYKFKGKRIATDGTMLYPFEDFVSVDRYHPFQGKLEDKAETKFYWYKDHPLKIWEETNDVVVFYKLHPYLLAGDPKFKTDKMYQDQYALFEKMTPDKFVQDTSFGEIMVYRRK